MTTVEYPVLIVNAPHTVGCLEIQRIPPLRIDIDYASVSLALDEFLSNPLNQLAAGGVVNKDVHMLVISLKYEVTMKLINYLYPFPILYIFGRRTRKITQINPALHRFFTNIIAYYFIVFGVGNP